MARRLHLRMLCLIATVAGPAGAFPSARLVYQRSPGAESCPDESALRHAVTERLGYDPFFPWADRTIVARIMQRAASLDGSVELLDSKGLVKGSRRLQAPATQCEELVSGLALAISIAVDPSSLDPAATRPDSDTPDPEGVEWAEAQEGDPTRPELPADAPAVDRSAGEATAPATASARWRPELSAGAVASVGLAPSSGFGPVLGVGLRQGIATYALEGRLQFVRDLTLDKGTVTSRLGDIALLGCLRPSVFVACVELSAGRLVVEGKGVDQPGKDALWVARIGPRAGFEIPVSEFLAVRTLADALFSLRRADVQLDGEVVWESPLAGGLFSLDLVGHFP